MYAERSQWPVLVSLHTHTHVGIECMSLLDSITFCTHAHSWTNTHCYAYMCVYVWKKCVHLIHKHIYINVYMYVYTLTTLMCIYHSHYL